ncbi:MAG: replication-associated recombination protein A [Gammaproteobacteria bacterium]
MTPLAEQLRPVQLCDFLGQRHLLDVGGALAPEVQEPFSMLLFGPPGTGKTTLGRLLARKWLATFQAVSAVESGVKELRQAGEAGRARRPAATLLFVDEIHRFSRNQQDVLLPYLEDGSLFLVGATTENPGFTLTSALLSRIRVLLLTPLSVGDLLTLLNRAEAHFESNSHRSVQWDTGVRDFALVSADGDARKLLNNFEGAISVAQPGLSDLRIDRTLWEQVMGKRVPHFDRGGDIYYDTLSAFHKSLRGSSPDATLYWFIRFTESGGDPRVLARRMVRAASEDIGNADPAALGFALHASEAFERLGEPEGLLALAQAAIYLAATEKSNAVYHAFSQAQKQVRDMESWPVPLHLRNAPTPFARSMGHGRGYRYSHDEPMAYSPGQTYFPEGIPAMSFYEPTLRGYERRLHERLKRLRELDKEYDKEGNIKSVTE